MHDICGIQLKYTISCTYYVNLDYECPSFSGRPLKQKCKGSRTWSEKISKDECRKKCEIQASKLGTPGCCTTTVGTAINCNFFANGEIDLDGWDDSMAVMCSPSGKMKYFFIIVKKKLC